MTSDYGHKVLVVDDEAQVGKAIGRILEKEKLEYVYADSGESALESLKKTVQPFSLIISDQRMPGIQGTQFLEHAKKLHPETIRFLITGYSEIQTIINAVNRGSVQRYISKPWNNDELAKTIQSGIGQYERFLENKNLIALAKKQNARLYELNCELMETAKAHGKEIETINTEILSIETQLKGSDSHPPPVSPALIMKELQAVLDPLGKKGQGMLNDLFSQTINALFNEFNDLSQRNGFEMPAPKGESMPLPGKEEDA
ncbi:MAG: response regulator [Desulfobacteraceae bacterium]|nr:response regulator [Desulfobacteraceae bacterium]